ncbi:MAG TPA: dihydrolipoyl dehydrogenase, partial [bacterium]|nr:dihydrolipoyl dehydrogenase [bacterium]
MIPKILTDVCVVGSGPGGYVAAIRAAQLGLQVTIIEDQYIGGTCLNVGCIPSKVLLDDSKLYATLDHLESRGISIGKKAIDLGKLQQRRQQVVDQLTGGVQKLLEGNNITIVNGRGVFQGPGQIRADNAQTGFIQVVEFDYAIVATGSVPATVPGLEFNGDTIVSSTEAMTWEEAPKRLVVIGAGAIGLEMASIWSRLGSQVTVVEFMDRIAPPMDEEVSKRALPVFKGQGIDFRLSTKALGLEEGKGGLRVRIGPAQGDGAEGTLEADKILVAVGRKPASANLGLDRIGVEVDDRGFIKVDKRQRTASRVIYAIGDVVGGIMYAHKASEEGIIAAENIAGHRVEMDRVIPGAIFTSPEIAHVGLTEQELKASGREYRKGMFKLGASGKALALGEPEGFAKVLGDPATGEILGVHILGAHASDLIAEA